MQNALKNKLITYWGDSFRKVSLHSQIKKELPLSDVEFLETIGLPEDDRVINDFYLGFRFYSAIEESSLMTFKGDSFVKFGEEVFQDITLRYPVLKAKTGEVFLWSPKQSIVYVNSSILIFLAFIQVYLHYRPLINEQTAYLTSVEQEYNTRVRIVEEQVNKNLRDIHKRMRTDFFNIEPLDLVDHKNQFWAWILFDFDWQASD